ncbi:MAG: redoxin domain-containing protein [Planctomycetia bacterium]|nr:redoxin domain-containing protein [Planctomycetia bacterium]
MRPITTFITRFEGEMAMTLRDGKFAVAVFAAAAVWLVTIDAARAENADAATPTIGAKIKDFTLADFRGKKLALGDLADKDLVVVAFLGNECPLSKLYGPRLEELHKEFAARGVAFVGINANQQDTPTEVAAYVRTSEITFPLLKDPGNVVADQFAAQRTPEVFLLDKDRTVRYHGRIDDQYGLGSSSGYSKPKVKSRDLAVAIEELLAGKTVSASATESPGCLIGRVAKTAPHGDVTYSNQIARFLQKRCVECHRPGEVAPFSLLDYSEVVGWAETMLEVIDEGRMPPWFANPEHGHFLNDARLTSEEKQLFRQWVKNGCPEGDKKDLPPPREFVAGWQIGQPDQVVYMSDKPYQVPAEGVVAYQYFAVDPGFKEDKWVQAVEARPGNRAVVHHIIAFAQAPRRGGDFRGGGGLAGYAPGDRARIYPPGVATFVPAGSKIIFQMHYTPNGTAQEDRSYVGIKFADPATVKKRARGGAAGNRWFVIPPGADNHEVVSEHLFGGEALLTTLFPHMHLRGKSFRYEAKYPDGTSEVLLDVPHYDFNWQLRYELAEPKLMPKGTKLVCTAHYDNSEENLANPNPKDTVRWGDQTWEEMMIGFFSTIPIQDDVGTESADSADGE